MATLSAGISASETVIRVSGTAPAPGSYFMLDSEAIRFLGTSRGRQGRSFLRSYWSVDRGVAGTTAATHANGATLTQYYPDATSSGGGGGLPSQWTDGGHGDVTATTDDASVPLTVTGQTTINPRATDAYGLLIQAAVGFYDVYNAFLRVLDEDGVHVMNIDQGGFDMRSTRLDGEIHARLTGLDGDRSAELSTTTGLTWGLTSLAQFIALSGQTGLQMSTFVPEFDPNAGSMQLYYDATDGAAKLRIRGKSADGTAVTGTVNLT